MEKRQIYIFFTVFFLVFSSAMVGVVHAGESVYINRVVADVHNEIIIYGEAFAAEPTAELQVWLDDTQLTITESSPTTIVASLGAGIEPGTYRLYVQQVDDKGKVVSADQMDVTILAVAGAVTIGESSAVCDSDHAGAIRYDDATGGFLGCSADADFDGTTGDYGWVSLSYNAGDSVPAISSAVTGKIWMDRNLGASRVAASSTDSSAYGGLYQWGRGSDGHEVRSPLSATTTAQYPGDVPDHGDFIIGHSNWQSSGYENPGLWQGADGINNPCPAGFRLPTAAEWLAESLSNTADAYDSLKLVVAGDRYYSNGTVHDAGGHGLYWSSTVGSGTVGGLSSSRLHFYSFGADVGSLDRAYGFSVRCLKD